MASHSGGGGRVKLLAIGGGVALAGVGVAVAAGGGNGGSGSGASPSSGSGAGSSPSSNQPPPSATLTGSWSGRSASNQGLSQRIDLGAAGNCTIRWNVDLTLTQNGNAVTGPGTLSGRTIWNPKPGDTDLSGAYLMR